MKVCAAQFKSTKGDILKNIERHLDFVNAALERDADAIFFPELSLTGYEPALAKDLAIHQDDRRLGIFQRVSDEHHLIIGVGVPTQSKSGVLISMIFFQPTLPREVYSKQILHDDELPYFTRGFGQVFLNRDGETLAPAICYESLQPVHSERAAAHGATAYIASVAKSKAGVEKAAAHFPAVAKRFGMSVMMANSVGYCDNFLSVGNSAIWNSNGDLAGRLDDSHEGILIFDSDTRAVLTQTM